MDTGLVVLLFVGCVGGFLNVMAGGGSLLTVPAMIFLGIPGPVANGTNRIAIIIQNIAAVSVFTKKGFANFKLSLSLGIVAVPGAVAGAWVAANLPEQDFNTLLAIIMIIVMLVMAFKPSKKERLTQVEQNSTPSKKQLIAGHLLMAVAGFWGGFIQIGIGFILMPILHRVMGLDLVTTNSLKALVVLIYTSVALAVFASQLELAWVHGITLAAGMALGGMFAANFQIQKGEKAINWVLNIVLVAFIIKLLFF
ncbi:MAG: sulfite exporter TauE/SafE family protein [Proteobacteria bacterium]|jgi:uncharacterized protein|nr:sulfite exporter TauE/SafE family protein [Pseudomonadota bacterium]